MPNIKSVKKRVKTSEKKNVQNVAQRSALRTSIKKAKAAIDTNAADKAEAVKTASINIDKAASKGLIKKQTAARKKSRLAKAANKVE